MPDLTNQYIQETLLDRFEKFPTPPNPSRTHWNQVSGITLVVLQKLFQKGKITGFKVDVTEHNNPLDLRSRGMIYMDVLVKYGPSRAYVHRFVLRHEDSPVSEVHDLIKALNLN